MTEWREHLYEDLEFHVRVRSVNEALIEFEVRELLLHGSDDQAELCFGKINGQAAHDLEEAEFTLRGSIRGNGRSHIDFAPGQTGYYYAQSRRDLTRFGQLFERLFDLAREMMPEHEECLR